MALTSIAELAMDSNLQNMISLCLLLIPLFSVLYISRKIRADALPNLPPSPPGLPIIGNLLDLGELPHVSLRRLSAKHGPLMYLRLGHIPTVVASSAEMAREFLKSQDLMFCTRPALAATRRLSYGFLDVAFSPYGEQWRQLRKITMMEVFNTNRVRYFKQIREEEINIFINSISNLSISGSSINLTEMLVCLFNNVIFREVFGRRSTGDKGRFHELVRESMALTSGFFVGDFLPSMEWVGVLTGMHSRLEKNFHDMDELLENEIDADNVEDENGNELSRRSPCFLKVLLQLQKDATLGFHLSGDHVKAILMDMFLGATDTSSITIEWAMTELMKNPATMNKARDQLRSVLGRKERVEENDLEQLPYLKMVTKETLRLHPPAPLLLPRECREECRVAGYTIPAKTRVSINVWAIGRDPKYWEEPEKFRPERFENSSVEYRGQHFQLLPFGGGRRICPGMSLGSVAVELVLANLLHCYDWELEDGIDMAETWMIM